MLLLLLSFRVNVLVVDEKDDESVNNSCQDDEKEGLVTCEHNCVHIERDSGSFSRYIIAPFGINTAAAGSLILVLLLGTCLMSYNCLLLAAATESFSYLNFYTIIFTPAVAIIHYGPLYLGHHHKGRELYVCFYKRKGSPTEFLAAADVDDDIDRDLCGCENMQGK